MIRFLLSSVIMAALLAGCNEGEDYGEVGGPIFGGGGISTFNPNENDPRHRTGRFINSAVFNIGYACFGNETFFGRIGQTGTDNDREIGLFRCPATTTHVRFFIGGSLAGDAGNRMFFPGEAVFKSGVEGQTIQISSRDLQNSPFRISDSPSITNTVALNTSGLLLALDTAGSEDAQVDIPDEVHNIVNDCEQTFTDQGFDFEGADPDPCEALIEFLGPEVESMTPIFQQTWSAFDADFDTLYQALEDLAQEAGDADYVKGSSALTLGAIEDRLGRAGRESVAGIYILDIPSFFNNVFSPDEENIYTDGIARSFGGFNLPGTDEIFACDPGSVSEGLQNADCAFNPLYSPVVYVDRQGNVFGGGPFWGQPNDLDSDDFFKSGVFMSLDRGAALDPDLGFNAFRLRGVGSDLSAVPARVDMAGRLVMDFTYIGETVEGASSDANTDYQAHYSGSGIPPLQNQDRATMDIEVFEPPGFEGRMSNATNDQKYFMVRTARFEQVRLDESNLTGPDQWGFPRRFSFNFKKLVCEDGAELSDCFDPGAECPAEDFVSEDGNSFNEEGFQQCIADAIADQEDQLQDRGDPLELVIDERGVVFIDPAEQCDSTHPESIPVGLLARMDESASDPPGFLNLEVFLAGDADEADLISQFGTRFSARLDFQSGFLVGGNGEPGEGNLAPWFDTFEFLKVARDLTDPETEGSAELSVALQGVFGAGPASACTPAP